MIKKNTKRSKFLRVNPSVIKKAGRILLNGGLVAFPTETVYGLGANALDQNAVEKIFIAKGRPSDNPLIVHIANKRELSLIAKNIPKVAIKLMDKFWPGPLTFVLTKKVAVPDVVTAGGSTVAVRMPNHPVALALIRAAGCPVAAPSANLAGKPSPTDAAHVAHDLGDRVDMILDGGETTVGLESTVIDVRNNKVEILRTGGVTAEMLEEVLGYKPKLITHSKGKVRSPGLKYKHYAPSVPMLLYGHEEMTSMRTAVQKKLKELQKNKLRVGILCITEDAHAFSSAEKIVVCGSFKHPQSFAQKLYYSLRQFNPEEVDIVLAEHVGKSGIGEAIFDRLGRAAEELF